MAKVTLKGNELNLKFTLRFWEKIKAEVNVTQETLEQRLKEDFGLVASNIVYFGIFYGLDYEDRENKIKDLGITIDLIKDQLDGSIIDVIEETYIEGMSRLQKEMVEIARGRQRVELEEIKNGDSSKKK